MTNIMYDQIVIIVMVITNIIAVVIINITVKEDSAFDIFTTKFLSSQRVS